MEHEKIPWHISPTFGKGGEEVRRNGVNMKEEVKLSSGVHTELDVVKKRLGILTQAYRQPNPLSTFHTGQKRSEALEVTKAQLDHASWALRNLLMSSDLYQKNFCLRFERMVRRLVLAQSAYQERRAFIYKRIESQREKESSV